MRNITKFSAVILFLAVLFNCKNTSKNKNQSLTSEETNEKKSIKSEGYDIIKFSNYTFNDAEGDQKTIKLDKNKLYILDFWYLECAPCIKDHKVVAKHVDSLVKIGIKVVGMSIDRDKKKWRNYLKNHNYNWDNYNQFSEAKILYKDLNIRLFPTYLVINDKGHVLNKSNRFEKALEYIKKENI